MQPLLTIITVTFNCEDVIGETLQSVLGSKPAEVEYMVVDGASTDGTLEKIRPWQDQIDQLISEPDEGIYHAMNKGLQLAQGDYVLFLNAGDTFFEPTTLPTLLDLLRENRQNGADILYGETMLCDPAGTDIGTRSKASSRKLPEQLHWKSLQRGMVVSHQSFIVRRSIAPPYKLKYSSSADIDWVISCLKNAGKVLHTQLVISRYRTGGYSKQRHPLSLKQRFQILQLHYGILPNLLNHLIILLRGAWFRIQGKDLN